MLEPGVVEMLTEVAAANQGLLWRCHLDNAGLTGRDIQRLLAAGALRRVHRGAYRAPACGEKWSREADLAAAARSVLLRDSSRVVTGPAALALLGLPMHRAPSVVHVGLDQRGGSSSRSKVRTVAALALGQTMSTPAGRVATPGRAILDTARLSSLVSGVMAADFALRRGMTSLAELNEMCGSMTRLPGVARARICAELACEMSESPGESWSAVVLHLHSIPRPKRQQEFRDDAGLIGRADFWWPEQRVAGEFDGRVKYGRTNPSGRLPEDVLWDEKVREDRLRALGLVVVRWTVSDLRSPAFWIARLRRALGITS